MARQSSYWWDHVEIEVGSSSPRTRLQSKAGKNLPAVSHLPDLTGNGKIPKTAGLPDLPVDKPIQI